MRQTTNVIKVAMSYHVSLQFVLDLLKIAHIGNAVVDTWQINAEIVSSINNYCFVLILNDDHILRSTLIHTAKRDNFQARIIVYHVCTLRFAVLISWLIVIE